MSLGVEALSFRTVARELCPPLLWNAAKAASKLGRKKIDMNAVIPWGDGYNDKKDHTVTTAINSAQLMSLFEKKQRLPEHFGIGVDERCVEYPWALANIASTKQRLLDAGSTFNHGYVLDSPRLANKKLHIVTLAPEYVQFTSRGIGYLYEDLRCLPFRDVWYDTVACISTLEHVGLDNSAYTNNKQHAENSPEDFTAAMKEMSRVLRPHGSLLLTVPYGRRTNYSSFQVFNSDLLTRAIEAFGDAGTVDMTFYRYGKSGWQISTEDECRDCEYASWVARVWDGAPWPNPLPIEPDKAAAARAVACVKIVKS